MPSAVSLWNTQSFCKSFAHASTCLSIPFACVQEYGYDFAINKGRRRVTITVTPLAFADGAAGLRHMAAGAAAEYILKYRSFGALYCLETYEVCLVPRNLGYPGCAEHLELSPDAKHSMKDCFLATIAGCAQVLGLDAEWVSSIWLSIA